MLQRLPERQFQRLGKRSLEFLGRQRWLDRPSYRLEHLLSFLYNALGGARDRVVNALNGVWLGHPVHPPLASLTSGALGTTVALDALSVLPGRPATELVDASRFARRALGLGILASVGAAVTGVTDWQHTHEEDRRVGLVHGVLNLFATVFTWFRGGNVIVAAICEASRSVRLDTESPSAAAIWAELWCSTPASGSTDPESGCTAKSGHRC